MRLGRFENIGLAVQHRIRKGISSRNAVALSMVLHFGVALAIGSLWVSNNLLSPDHSDGIVFDLTTVKEAIKQNAQSPSEYGVPNREASKESGKASNLVKGNMNRDAVLMASLTSLSDLRASFSFMMQSVSSDSIGGFAPLDGDIPGSDYNAFGNKNGEGHGFGNGAVTIGGGRGGDCPPPPRILP